MHRRSKTKTKTNKTKTKTKATADANTPTSDANTPPDAPQAAQEQPQATATLSTLPTQSTTPPAAQTPPTPALDALSALTPADIDRDPIAAAAIIDPTAKPAELEDLKSVNVLYRAKIIKMLYYMTQGADIATLRQKMSLSFVELSHALNCKLFAKLYANIRRARQFAAAEEIEAAQSALAAGLTAKNADFLPPDPTAAKLILQAHDPLYHPGQSAPVTAINIQVNGLPI